MFKIAPAADGTWVISSSAEPPAPEPMPIMGGFTSSNQAASSLAVFAAYVMALTSRDSGPSAMLAAAIADLERGTKS
jgi:hypothetical protein